MSEPQPEPATRRISRFEWACLGVVALAFLVRLFGVLHPNAIWDSGWYLLLARSFGEHGSFLIPWHEQPAYSGYWPPLYPILVSPLVKLLGPSYSVLALASTLLSALLVLAVFLTTRDLFRPGGALAGASSAPGAGRTRAFAAMALVAANPAWLLSDGHGMSESTLALMVTLAVWAFLRSLERPAFLPVAGGFAMLAYLGKATLGLPIVALMVAALAAWRVRVRGLHRVLRSPMDLALAGAALVALLVAGLTRSGKLGGVGVGLIDPIRQAIAEPLWAPTFAFKLVFASAFLLVVTLPFSLGLGRAARAGRAEGTDALWLAVLLPLVAGAMFTTSFFFTERRPLVDFDNIRYLTPSIVPFLWLVLPHWRAEDDPVPAPGAERQDIPRTHWTWFGLAVGAYTLLLLFSPFAGVPSLGRVQAFLVLALAPLALALAARGTHYALVERRQAGGARSLRYVRAPAEGANAPAVGVAAVAGAVLLFTLGGLADALFRYALLPAGVLLLARVGHLRLRREAPPRWAGPALLALAGAALAYYVSAWYAAVFLGLAVAASAASRRASVVAMALVLLAATAPSFYTPFPAEGAAADLARLVPEGALVGITEPAVYFTAVAPENVTLRLTSMPPPEGIDYVLVNNRAGETYANFTKLASWDYRFVFFPTLEWRLEFEEAALGKPFELRSQEGMSLWVRDGAQAG